MHVRLNTSLLLHPSQHPVEHVIQPVMNAQEPPILSVKPVLPITTQLIKSRISVLQIVEIMLRTSIWK